MVQLFFLDCSPLLDQLELDRALPLLDESRRNKVNRFPLAEKKAQCAAVGLLLRHLFGDVAYRYGENGKPYLANRTDLFFNVSHSGNYVVCAISDTDIGVDIEVGSAIRPAVMRRCFNTMEQEWIDNDSKHFIRLWTMKEAYMKLVGSGLSLPPIDISLPISPTNGYDEQNRCWWYLSEWNTPVSLCCDCEQTVEERHITIKDLL